MLRLFRHKGDLQHFEEGVHDALFDHQHAPLERFEDMEQDLRATYSRLRRAAKTHPEILKVDQISDLFCKELWIGAYIVKRGITIFFRIAETVPQGEVLVAYHGKNHLSRIHSHFGQPTDEAGEILSETSLAHQLDERLGVRYRAGIPMVTR